MDEIYTGEIHMFANIYKAEYTASLGLLPGHVVFYKIDLVEINSNNYLSMLQSIHDRLSIMLELGNTRVILIIIHYKSCIIYHDVVATFSIKVAAMETT